MYARIPTNNISNTVERTIARKIITDLKANLSMDTTAFIALDNMFEDKTYRSGVNVPLDGNLFESPITERISAKIENRKLSEYVVTNLTNDTRSLFKNKHIHISTEFISHEMEISINYHTKSKVNADEVVNYLKDHAITKGNGYVHSVDYYYLIPDSLLGLLEDIYVTGKVNYDDGKTFVDFLAEGNVLGAITLTSSINGLEGGDLGLAVIATNRIYGSFDVDLKNVVKEFDSESYTWTVSLTYKFNYMSPESFIIDYAVLINNAMIPAKYITQEYVNATDPRREKGDLYKDGFTVLEYKQNLVPIPPYDNHKVKVQDNNILKPIVSILTAITPSDLKTLLSLDDLIYYNIKSEYLDYMKANYTSLVKPFRKGFDSMFTVDLYDGNALISKSNLTIDENLNLSSIEDLPITGVYRVVVSIVVDLGLLTNIGLASLTPLGDLNKMGSIIEGIKLGDYRIADGNAQRYILPTKPMSSMITAQTSIIKTFLNVEQI